MRSQRGIRKWLRLPASVRPLERDVADEVQFHLESRIEELVASGVDPASAREQAEREFGDVPAARRELARIDHRREHRRRWAGRLEALRHEWGAALRGLVRAPGFTLAVALTLALGIGANATMFGVIDRLMLRPSPHVHDADRLRRVFVRLTHPHWGTFTQNAISLPVVTALSEDPAFAGAAASWSTSGSLGRGRDAQRGAFLVVTPSLFTITGVAPYLGRFFTEDDDVNSAGTPAAVLGYSFWQRRYGGDSTIVGRTIDAFGTPFTVVGIAPPGYRGFETRAVDLFLPMSTVARTRIGSEWATTTNWFWINAAVKIAAGVSEEQARTRAELLYQRVYASDSSHARAHILFAPVIPGRGPTPSPEERVAVWLVGVAVIVLAIATANVANLLLTRAARRRREIAVRVALGVSRQRLVTQLLFESVLLAFLGAIGALLLTQWGGALVRGVLLGELAPEDSIIDVRVFVVAALVALGAGLAAGLAPAVLATGPAATDALKAGGRGATYRRSRLRAGLLVAQAMLSLVLVVGAALFVRSLTNAVREPLGIDTRRVLLSDMDLEAAGFGPAERRAIYDRALERVAQLPLVESAALTTTVPFYTSMATELRVEGVDSLPRFADGGPYITRVGPEYFQTLGMHVTRGRFLNKDDVRGSPSVAVVNETMARRIWQGRDALGTCLFIGEESRTCTRVVGVVNNARRGTIGRDEEAVLYYAPLAQDTTATSMLALLVRVRGEPRTAVPAVQDAMQSVNSSLPFADVRVLQELVEPHLRPWRLGATLFVVFGCIALALAAVGLYSVVSYDTAQRTQEIGVRIALGAGRSRILKMVLADGLRSAGAGVALGVLAALAAGGALASLLYEVSPRDPLLLTLSTLLMLVVALVATAVPAWRATRIAPNNALRSE